jgi:hypothetical protein
MPASQITRQRVVGRDTCIVGFTGTQYVKSMVFDATTLSPDSNGFYYVPAFSFVTPSVANDPTKIKVYQGLGTNVNAVQTVTITGAPTGGTFTLTYSGQTTAAIPYNATAAQVQAALVALSNIASAANVLGGGGALPATPVTVTFQSLLGNLPQAVMTAAGSFTGGTTPAVSVATTTAGQTAEHIVGVFDNLEYDFFGNAVNDDEPVPIYDQFTAFDTAKLKNWLAYGATARAALPNCTFQP